MGVHLVRELIRSGYPVRALVRTHEKAHLIPEEAEVFFGTMLDANAINEALKGIEVAYYLVHSMAENKFDELDRTSADLFRNAAIANQVQQVVYLGALRTTSHLLL